MKILLDFVVDKNTKIQTLESKFSQASKILRMLDSRIKARGCKAETRVQHKNVAQFLPKISKSQWACLRKTKAAEKKRSLQKT